MYLVDTSVWIDYLKARETAAVMFLDELLRIPMAVGLCDQVYMEILQGAGNKAGFLKLQKYFSTQSFYRFEHPQYSHEAAALVYFNCRCQGISVRSSIDCLIAQCALEHDLVLLHNDQDFHRLATVVPRLQQKHFLLPM